ncbi:peptide/nickel transport system ATP-binding protein [Meinhardsimonia xiamenensis]|jgi:peptide/nickel transport system ATP-binding protein|uniref:Peptide/nickel transport system ATP-binding protein n=1 Tax=Meinhardsimonia xiamenensis TaxID=990712 RepID=A0A1G9GC83_9RHOB|nr:ABC transporter ATP-binding protein [Meinhardsimonia xiamenensis]PRX31967.1 peptide/nickel transport system ATP-binding protein [Meinhardsimonia xiamenensis]SDK98279.1 peptide/nickel transport system ATP-binding protein [Meinhardsimonia xiamenensis]
MLSIRDLSLEIAGTPILHGVSLDVAPGKVFGLVGESGSGKSMTALSVMRLLPQGARLRGRVSLGGTELTALDERQMCAVRGARVAMIFQEPMTALNPLRTIGEQVAETLVVHGAAPRGEAMRIAREKLDRVGLAADRFDLGRYPFELSGGQRQRVCIAMAIALRPAILIADEPTTALDVTTQAQILALLESLVREEGMGLMLITHDLAVVAGMADEVAVMREGRIVERGPTETLFRTRRHPYTRALLAASSHVPKRAALRSAGAPPVLEVEGAVRDYPLGRGAVFGARGHFRAVDGVSLAVGRGESVGLVGESGCGKSTLARAILGLEPLQVGAIRLEGAPVDAARGVPGALRAKMQVVFQDPFGSFNPRHRVARLVAEPFHLVGRPPDWRDRVAEALQAVGLKPADMEKFPHEFSGGQRQRIAIARAIVIRPRLVILDEAVSALDVSIRAQILELLADLQGRFGLSYLFISHDLAVVRAITDRVLVMRAGRIVEEGPTEAVFAAPRHGYTRQLLAATPRIPEDWLAEETRHGA